MKFLIALSLSLSLSNKAFAKNKETVDWTIETGTLVLKNSFASYSLYRSLNVEYTLAPQSTNDEQVRIKENSFARCEAHYVLISRASGGVKWVMHHSECTITAPAGTVTNL